MIADRSRITSSINPSIFTSAPRFKRRRPSEGGRAQFNGLTRGRRSKPWQGRGRASRIQEFPAPAQGGIRLLLVATDKSKKSAPASTAAVSGEVTLGGESRIVIEPGEEVVPVYYVLDIVNGGSAPVNPATPFAFDMPAGGVGSAVLEGSSSQASVSSGHVKVLGPFAPGRTTVQVVTELPAAAGSVQLTQRFPAPLERLAIIVKKVGPTTLSSAQIASSRLWSREPVLHRAGGGGCRL